MEYLFSSENKLTNKKRAARLRIFHLSIFIYPSRRSIDDIRFIARHAIGRIGIVFQPIIHVDHPFCSKILITSFRP